MIALWLGQSRADHHYQHLPARRQTIKENAIAMITPQDAAATGRDQPSDPVFVFLASL